MLKTNICLLCKQKDYATKVENYDSLTLEQRMILQKSLQDFSLKERWICPISSLKWVNGMNSSMVSKESDVPPNCPYSLEQVVGGESE